MRDQRTKLTAVPGLFSLLAFVLAWIAITQVHGNVYLSFAWVGTAIIADMLDGAIARAFGQVTATGRWLDSFVDVFIYLVYPAVVLYRHFNFTDSLSLLILTVFFVCGVFRLFRFAANGFVTTPSGRTVYQGLPVFFAPALMLMLLSSGTHVTVPKWVVEAFVLAGSVLMTLKFPFPKPRTSFALLLSIAGLSAIFFVYGITH